MPTDDAADVDRVAAELTRRAETLPDRLAYRRTFTRTYQRTTEAVAAAIRDARFEDPGWVARWDVAFAEFYLSADAADRAGEPVPRPWRLAFDAPERLGPLVHVLLGMNAHINYDLPQALLAVIDDSDFADPVLLARRSRDHERIDRVLAARVGAEDRALGGRRTVRDLLLQPVNRWSATLILRESRAKVWQNTLALQQARLAGPERYAARLAELEVLAAARIVDLLRPGAVLPRLAAGGFGVALPPP